MWHRTFAPSSYIYRSSVCFPCGLEPLVRLELTTPNLQNWCSTTELKGHKKTSCTRSWFSYCLFKLKLQHYTCVYRPYTINYGEIIKNTLQGQLNEPFVTVLGALKKFGIFVFPGFLTLKYLPVFFGYFAYSGDLSISLFTF